MKKAQGAVVFRTDDPLAGRDYRPAMPGDNPDFWEGSQWDLLGFAAEYLWVFGIVLAIVSSLYAVTSYNQDEEAGEPTDSAVIVESSSITIHHLLPLFPRLTLQIVSSLYAVTSYNQDEEVVETGSDCVE
ncbi:unnamed protein product [Closterium sp. Naga37s-1]|nr:unnamed protein product [Closterium sp. Naga37s-1]